MTLKPWLYFKVKGIIGAKIMLTYFELIFLRGKYYLFIFISLYLRDHYGTTSQCLALKKTPIISNVVVHEIRGLSDFFAKILNFRRLVLLVACVLQSKVINNNRGADLYV